MDSPENRESLDGGVNYDGKVVALDLDFLFNMFMREGAVINLRVIRGIPEGAKAVMAGISDGSLVVIFDTIVPEDIWFEDLNEDKGVNPILN